MASKRVKELINAFRNHFRGNTEGNVPAALQQESFDIVYTALLEDDENPMPTPAPLLDTLALPMQPAGMGPADLDLNALLGEAIGTGQPEVQFPVPQAPAEPDAPMGMPPGPPMPGPLG